MTDVIKPLKIFMIFRISWLNRQQLTIINYLIEGNRVLKEQLGDRRLRLPGHQCRQLAMKAKCVAILVMAKIITMMERLFHWLDVSFRRKSSKRYYRVKTLVNVVELKWCQTLYNCRTDFRNNRRFWSCKPELVY